MTFPGLLTPLCTKDSQCGGSLVCGPYGDCRDPCKGENSCCTSQGSSPCDVHFYFTSPFCLYILPLTPPRISAGRHVWIFSNPGIFRVLLGGGGRLRHGPRVQRDTCLWHRQLRLGRRGRLLQATSGQILWMLSTDDS